MKRIYFSFLMILTALLMSSQVFSQINTGGSPQVPFGSNSRYEYGIMPTNLPSGGTYGQSQDAASAYNTWKTTYVESCSGGRFRVKFDTPGETVSEGIAYGMLLSVYAADKALFDGLWAYYKQFRNGNGVMDWKISGCDGGVVSSGAATDAELDAAMALIIASEQWNSTTYRNDAITLIQAIKNTEMATNGQTLNGDQWGNTNTCRNPSYQSPGYYKQYALVDTDNASFWGTTAINAASTLLLANRNSTSGLVSNWCDNNGSENTCGNTGSGAEGYGADACRTPWRTAIDYLWHGNSACAASKDINTKLINFVNGYENQMKGPLRNRNVSNPSSGSYVNGSYATFALPPMTSSSAQSSLNKCYTAVTGLSGSDYYFNATVRCLTLFVLTGNFWAPGASGAVFPPTITKAETNGDGTKITLTTNKTLQAASVTASTFTLYLNNVAQSNGISSVSISGETITLNIATAAIPQPGQTITLSYSGSGDIKSSEGAAMEAFTKREVLNLLEGNETILDDCEDGNELNNVGGIWFTFNDQKDQEGACQSGSKSTVTPLTSSSNPFVMSSPGYNSDYAVKATYTLGTNYTPYDGGSCASWTNPAYIGIGTWVDKVETNTMDWTSGIGVKFWYKGPACAFQIIIEEVTDYCFHKKNIDACADWTEITVLWSELAQPTWGVQKPFTAQHVQKLQWQYEKGASADNGTIWIDDVRILNMPPVPLTSMTIGVHPDSKVTDPLNLKIDETDTLELAITTQPTNASYPVVFWSSSDETVAVVDYLGRVFPKGYGETTITARSKMHQSITATYTVKVPAPSVPPTGISFSPTSYTIPVGTTDMLLPIFAPIGVTETDVTWSSSNSTIASVNATGVVTGVSVGGPVTITATSKTKTNVKGTATVTVVGVGVTEITVDKNPITMTIGESETVTATVLPANATNKSVAWSTTNSAIATVTNGVIASQGVGSCTIRVTSNDNSSKYVDIPVTVKPIAVTSVSVTPKTVSLVDKASTTLSATVLPSGAEQGVSWSSANTNIATVANGIVTATGVGSTTITVTSTSDNTKSDICVVTVTPKLVESITLNHTTRSLIINETTTLTATVSPANATDPTYVWESSNEAIATVNSSGVVTALAEGTANITATANDASGVVGTCVVTVSPRLVTNISVLPATLSLVIDETSNPLTATVIPNNATDPTYVWESSNTAVATVDNSGVVTALAEGTANITATANDASGIVGTCVVTVTPIMPNSVSISSEIGFVIGDPAQQLTAVFDPINTTNQAVTWESSDESIATVVDGLVTAVGVGSCIVTVRSVADNTVFATCVVTVDSDIVNVSGVSLDQNEVTIFIQASHALTATVNPHDATNKSVKWSSDNTNIAEVVNGTITGVSVGNTIIRVETVDGLYEATCIVNVKAIPVAGVSLNESSLSLAATSAPVQLVATINPTNATNQAVSWSSNNEAVVTVNNMGIITVQGIGEAIITVTTVDGNYSATCNVEITAIDVTSITLNHPSLELTPVSAPVTLEATITPLDASDKTVSWSVTDPDIVSVTNGVVSVIGVGSTKVVATSNSNPLITGVCFVTVNPIAVDGVSLNESSLSLAATSGPVQLVATVNPINATNQAVSWSSNNEAVVTVNNMGIITVQGVGDAIITVTTVDGNYFATCNVEVIAVTTSVTGVTVSPQSHTIQINESLSISATVVPTNATNKDIVWTSSNNAIATVDANGVVTPIAIGTVDIIATTVDGDFSDICKLTITDILTTHIFISNSQNLVVGETVQISVENVLPVGASTDVTWASDNEAVATIDANGVITAISVGDANITAIATDGTLISSNECLVTVSKIDVTAVTVMPTTAILEVGGASLQLQANVQPSNATNKDVTWTVNNGLIASVDNTGMVTPLAKGTVIVTATSAERDIFKGTCTIQVVDKAELVATIADVQLVYNTAVTGTAVGQYPASAKTALQLAITTAQAVANNTQATQEQVDAAIVDLLKAEQDFYKKQIVNETLIFNAELENLTYLNTYWYSYNDSEPGGSSSVTPLTDASSSFTMSQTGAQGTEYAAMIDYSLMGSAVLGYSPFVGMGMAMNDPESAYDLTGSTGMSFWVKSQHSYFLEINLESITDDCNYHVELPAALEWTEIRLSWSDFEQYSWGIKVPWDLTEIMNFQWKIQAADGTAGQLWIDEVRILGKLLDLPPLNIVDKSNLDAIIVQAQTLRNSAQIGNGDGQYPQSAATTFDAAISSALTTQADESVTQIDVDAAVIALQTAIEQFNSQRISVDKTALLASIQTAQNFHNVSTEGAAEGQYPIGSKANLQAAINTANNIYTNTLASQEQVNQAKIAVDEALLAFQNLVVGVNKGSLFVKIQEATTLHANSEEGTANGQFPVGSKANFYAAISSAQGVYDNSQTTQLQVNQAVSDLNSAIAAFEALRIYVEPLNKTLLASKINEANEALDLANGNTGDNPGNYPVSAVNTFTSAISTAQSVYDNATTQNELNQQIITLQAAISEFLLSEIPVPIDKLALELNIAEADELIVYAETGVLPGQYPQTAWTVFYNAIQSARVVYNKPTATQEEVDAKNESLLAAIQAFKDAMNPVSIESVSLVAKTYPNPVVSQVTIEAPSHMSEITVMSVLGEIVRVEKVNATNVSIDMQNQANGIYLISITYKNGKTETVRIIKQ